MTSGAGRIRVKLVRGLAGKRRRHQACVAGLGLRRPWQEVELEDTPAIRGLINKVRYMLQVQAVQREEGQDIERSAAAKIRYRDGGS